MTLLLDKLRAVLRRDLLTALRYRRSYWVIWAGVALELATFYYLSRAVGPGFRPDGMDFYSFLLAGTALYTFLMLGVGAFVEAVREAQATGTMEVLMNTNTSPAVTISLSAGASVGGRLLQSVGYVVLGLLLFPVALHGPNLLGCALVLAVFTALIAALGILGAAVQVWIQRGSLVTWVLGTLGTLLTGVMFPVSALPHWLQVVAQAVPLTYALSAFRIALLQHGTMAELSFPLGMLTLFTVALVPLSLGVFSLVVRHARRDGSLAWY